MPVCVYIWIGDDPFTAESQQKNEFCLFRSFLRHADDCVWDLVNPVPRAYTRGLRLCSCMEFGTVILPVESLWVERRKRTGRFVVRGKSYNGSIPVGDPDCEQEDT